MFSDKSKIAKIVLLVILLALVRVFENRLFYDPFLAYFKGEYLSQPFPDFDAVRLFFAMTFRYFLNAFISLAIVQVLFADIAMTKFASALYLIFFVVLIVVFFLLVKYSDSSNNLVFFYIRRFLIQPLFLLLFVPAFYYHKRIGKK